MTRSVFQATILLLAALPGYSQEPLTLIEAARLALESNPALEGAAAGEQAADAGVRVAAAGRLPRLSWQESYTRSNNPVFAFGTLLNQRRFTEANFAINTLNNPASVQNFQSLVRVEQTLFDAHRTKSAIAAARLQKQMSEAETERRQEDVLLGVVQTYFGADLAAAGLATTQDALRSVDADLERAQAMFDAGMATQADVLAVQAHRAAIEQQRIQAAGDAEVAIAALNDALGLPLETPRTLSTPLAEASAPADDLAGRIALARGERPDLRQAQLGVDMAAENARQAGAARLPQVFAQGALEADRARFVNQGGGNWLAGVGMRWDLWKGGETQARIDQAAAGQAQAEAARRRAASAAELEVRQAWTAFSTATERLRVAGAAIEQAEESLRIVRNRYQAGLEDVTSLLRSENALTGARFQRLAALYDQRVARAKLDHAAGVLTLSSEALL
ncbi:MAG: hypothetical protein GC160_06960 [Acidobacteria bacterium]|nr:hypothetical protein [Acidobacteriota bacterium]